MTTRKLLGRMTWRGAVWGLAVGLIVNFGLILLILVFMLIPPSPNDLESVGGHNLVLGFIGLVVILYVTNESLWIGLGSGLFLGILTRSLFYPVTDGKRYVRVAKISAVPANVGICISSAVWFWRTVGMSDPDTELWFPTIPVLLAGFAAWFLTPRIVRWYEKEMQKQSP